MLFVLLLAACVSSVSLLFAMFATLDAFDWLLFKPLPPTDPPEVCMFPTDLYVLRVLRRMCDTSWRLIHNSLFPCCSILVLDPYYIVPL